MYVPPPLEPRNRIDLRTVLVVTRTLLSAASCFTRSSSCVMPGDDRHSFPAFLVRQPFTVSITRAEVSEASGYVHVCC